MYWGRKYYLVSFSSEYHDMRIRFLKSIDSVKISHAYKFNMQLTDDQLCTVDIRRKYQMLVSCKPEDVEAVEYELRKAKRNDSWCSWEEIKRDTSKKYFDINGHQMKFRKCDMNPQKRCNHCMDC